MLNSGKGPLMLFGLFFWLPQSQSEGLQVRITNRNDYCLVVPKDPHTSIGASEYDGGEAVWCEGSKTSPFAGTFKGSFWSQVEITSPKAGVMQMTGCINLNSCDRLRSDDSGGQYDSNGGAGGKGNPARSSCAGDYRVYVQLIEPSARRACIRCCKNAADCDVTKDQSGCQVAIPGNYFGCTA